MYVNRIDDPRGPLQLASRDELYQYAKANGVKEIDEAMYMGAYAAERMKKILSEKGLTNLKTKLRTFGSPPEEPVREMVTPTIDHKVMSRAELAKECKRRGIKMQRTDNKEKLIERLS